MKMKIFSIAMLLGTVVLLGGCKKFLTEQPLTQVTADSYFKSLKDVNSAMSGVYASFQIEMIGDGTNAYGGKYHYWGEARSDNFDRSQYPNSQIQELALNQINPTNSTADYSGLYRTINRINQCIQYIPLAAQTDNNVTPAVVNNSLAQCYAMRAMCYFYLVRIWGDAVVWTEPYTDITVAPARARTPKAQVMTDIVIGDLTKAYNLIPKTQTPTVWYIGEGAICAIMADAYMWQKDYPNAIVWVKNLFKAKGPTGAVYAGTASTLEPTATWKNVFLTPAASAEPIWSIYWNNTLDGCACIPIGAQKSNNPIRVDSVFQVKWKALYKVDTRVGKTIDTLTTVGHFDKVYKYYNFPSTGIPTAFASDPTSLNVYLPMYRLGDIYLLYAEALNYTGDKTNALVYLNYIRTRAGYTTPILATDAAVSTTEKLEDVILQERQYELFGEGKRWFDLVRTGRVNTVMDPIINYRAKRLASNATNTFGTDLNKVLWPILRQNLEDNKLLVQNPSY